MEPPNQRRSALGTSCFHSRELPFARYINFPVVSAWPLLRTAGETTLMQPCALLKSSGPPFKYAVGLIWGKVYLGLRCHSQPAGLLIWAQCYRRHLPPPRLHEGTSRIEAGYLLLPDAVYKQQGRAIILMLFSPASSLAAVSRMARSMALLF